MDVNELRKIAKECDEKEKNGEYGEKIDGLYPEEIDLFKRVAAGEKQLINQAILMHRYIMAKRGKVDHVARKFMSEPKHHTETLK